MAIIQGSSLPYPRSHCFVCLFVFIAAGLLCSTNTVSVKNRCVRDADCVKQALYRMPQKSNEKLLTFHIVLVKV